MPNEILPISNHYIDYILEAPKTQTGDGFFLAFGFAALWVVALYVKLLDQIHHAPDFGMGVFQIEEAHFPIVFVIDGHDFRQDFADLGEQGVVLHDFGDAVVAHEFAVDNGQHLDLGVLRELLEDVFVSPAAEIKLAVREHVESEGAAFGPVAVCGQEIEDLGLVQKIVDFFDVRHDDASLDFMLLSVFSCLFGPFRFSARKAATIIYHIARWDNRFCGIPAKNGRRIVVCRYPKGTCSAVSSTKS